MTATGNGVSTSTTELDSTSALTYATPKHSFRWMKQGKDVHAKLLELNTHPHQRTYDATLNENGRVARYYSDMVQGRWAIGADNGLIFGRVGDIAPYQLLNGQHRLTAAMKALEDCGVYVPFALNFFTFSTEDEMNIFFSTIDDTYNRTGIQRLNILGTPEYLEIPSPWVKQMIAGLRVMASGFVKGEQSRLTNAQDKHHALKGAHVAAKAYYENALTDPTMARALKSSPVIGFGLLTYYYQPEKAAEFWGHIVSPEQVMGGSPEVRIREYMIANKIAITNSGSPHTPPMYSNRIACAWNAFYRGETIDKLSSKRDKNGIIIEGTPFDGSHFDIGKEIAREWINKGASL